MKKKEQKPNTIIQNCEFIGYKWDKEALKVANNVTEGLLNMTKLFNNQQLRIDTAVKIDGINNVSVMDNIVTGFNSAIDIK